MHFQKDVFISYAHIDDESLVEGQSGWVASFHRALETRLAQVMGRKPIIWRDPRLQGNHVFDQQIVDQFKKVAVMISIISPRYVKSEWCLRELNEFYEACNRDSFFQMNNKARIFKVIKTPVNFDLHPAPVKNLLGYEFYQTDSSTGRFSEYALGYNHQFERLYWEKLNDLVSDISLFLEEVEHWPNPQQNPALLRAESAIPYLPITVTAPARKIFIAESTFDNQQFRENIKRELQDRGFIILPDKPLPLQATLLPEVVKNYMKDAELSIHLIGDNYGIVPEGSHKSIIEIQNELCAGGQVPQLIWIPENNNPMDNRQDQFIESLLNTSTRQSDADVIKSTLEEFKNITVDKLLAIQVAKDKKNDNPAGNLTDNGRSVYLMCDMMDVEQMQPLEDFLFSQGYEVIIPVFEGSESLIREDHIENLKICTAAIIFFGYANELWLRSKMRDFFKIKGYGRSQPLEVKAVYLAGPVSTGKQRFRTLEADIINGIEGVPQKKLIDILSKPN